MLYLVKWSIDLNADTPEEAAAQALKIHRDPDSTATFFEVSSPNEFGGHNSPVYVEVDNEY